MFEGTDEQDKMRTSPNIIITGTPGVGKTTHCEELARRSGLKHLSVNQVVKDRECHEGWDDEFQSWIVDEDKVGILHPSSRLFPPRPFSLGRYSLLDPLPIPDSKT